MCAVPHLQGVKKEGGAAAGIEVGVRLADSAETLGKQHSKQGVEGVLKRMSEQSQITQEEASISDMFPTL